MFNPQVKQEQCEMPNSETQDAVYTDLGEVFQV